MSYSYTFNDEYNFTDFYKEQNKKSKNFVEKIV